MTKKNKTTIQSNSEKIAEELKISEQEELKKIAQKEGLTYQPYSELNNYIQYAIGDNVQAIMDIDEKGNASFKNGIVRYNYGKNNKPLKNRPTAEIEKLLL